MMETKKKLQNNFQLILCLNFCDWFFIVSPMISTVILLRKPNTKVLFFKRDFFVRFFRVVLYLVTVCV